MRILSIDPSTSALGWAVSDNKPTAKNTEFGTRSFNQYNDDYGKLFAAYGNWLADKIAIYKPGMIAIEGVNPGLKGNARYLLTGIDAITHMTAFLHDKRRHTVTPTQVKKFATGSGSADKAAMVDAITKLGYKPKDDNQADAIAILLHCAEYLNKPE